MQVQKDHVRITKVVGENEDGLTLFVPKSEEGVFHLSQDDKFLTIMFVKKEGSALTPWLPWAKED